MFNHLFPSPLVKIYVFKSITNRIVIGDGFRFNSLLKYFIILHSGHVLKHILMAKGKLLTGLGWTLVLGHAFDLTIELARKGLKLSVFFIEFNYFDITII